MQLEIIYNNFNVYLFNKAYEFLKIINLQFSFNNSSLNINF